MVKKVNGSNGQHRDWRLSFTIYWCLFKIFFILLTLGVIIMTSGNRNRNILDKTGNYLKFEENWQNLNRVKGEVNRYNKSRNNKGVPNGSYKPFYRIGSTRPFWGTHHAAFDSNGIGHTLNGHGKSAEIARNQMRLLDHKVMAPLQQVVMYPPIFRVVWTRFQRDGVKRALLFQGSSKSDATRGNDLRNDMHKTVDDVRIRQRFARIRLFLRRRRLELNHFAPGLIQGSQFKGQGIILLPILLAKQEQLLKQRLRLAKLRFLQKIREHSENGRDFSALVQLHEALASKMVHSFERGMPRNDGAPMQIRKDDVLIREPPLRYLRRMFLFRPKDFLVKTLKSQKEFSRSWISFGRMWQKEKIYELSIKRKQINAKNIRQQLNGNILSLHRKVLNDHVNALVLMLRRRKRLGLVHVTNYFNSYLRDTKPVPRTRQILWKRMLKERDILVKHFMLLKRLRLSHRNLQQPENAPKVIKRRLYKIHRVRRVFKTDKGKFQVRVLIKSKQSTLARKPKRSQRPKDMETENSNRKELLQAAHFKLLHILIKSNQSIQTRIVEQEAMVKQLKTTLENMKIQNSRWRANTERVLAQLCHAFDKMKNSTWALLSPLTTFPYLFMREDGHTVNNESVTHSYWIFQRLQVTVIRRRIIFDYARNAAVRFSKAFVNFFHGVRLQMANFLSFLKPSRIGTEKTKGPAHFPKMSYIRNFVMQTKSATKKSENASTRPEYAPEKSLKNSPKKVSLQIQIRKPAQTKPNYSKIVILTNGLKPKFLNPEKTSKPNINSLEKINQGRRRLQLKLIRNIVNVYAQRLAFKQNSDPLHKKSNLEDMFKSAIRTASGQIKDRNNDEDKVGKTNGFDVKANGRETEGKIASNHLQESKDGPKLIKTETEKKQQNNQVKTLEPAKIKAKLIFFRKFTHSDETSTRSPDPARRLVEKNAPVKRTDNNFSGGSINGKGERSRLSPGTEHTEKVAKEPLTKISKMSTDDKTRANIHDNAEKNEGNIHVKQMKENRPEPWLTLAGKATAVKREEQETNTNMPHSDNSALREPRTFKFKQISPSHKLKLHKLALEKTGSQTRAQKTSSFRLFSPFSPWMASTQILMKTLFWLTQAPHRAIAFIRRLEMANIRLRMEVLSRFLNDEDTWFSKKSWPSSRTTTKDKTQSWSSISKNKEKAERFLFNRQNNDPGSQTEGKSNKVSSESQHKFMNKEGNENKNLNVDAVKSSSVNKHSKALSNDIPSGQATQATSKHQTDKSMPHQQNKVPPLISKLKEPVVRGMHVSDVRETVTLKSPQGNELTKNETSRNISELNEKNLRDQNADLAFTGENEKQRDQLFIRKSRSLLSWSENEGASEATQRLRQMEKTLDDMVTAHKDGNKDVNLRHMGDRYEGDLSGGDPDTEDMRQTDNGDMNRQGGANVQDSEGGKSYGDQKNLLENDKLDEDDLSKSGLQEYPADDENRKEMMEKQKHVSEEVNENKNKIKQEIRNIRRYGDEAQKMRKKLLNLMELVRENRHNNAENNPQDIKYGSKGHMKEINNKFKVDSSGISDTDGTEGESSKDDKQMANKEVFEEHDTSKDKQLFSTEQNGVDSSQASIGSDSTGKKLPAYDIERKGNSVVVGNDFQNLDLEDSFPYNLPARKHKGPTESDKKLLSNIEKLTYMVLGRHGKQLDLSDASEHSSSPEAFSVGIEDKTRKSKSLKRRLRRDVDIGDDNDEEDGSKSISPFDILRSHVMRTFRRKWFKMRKVAEILHEDVLKALADYSDVEKELRLLLERGDALATRIIKVTKKNNIDSTLKKADWKAAQRAFKTFQSDIRKQERKLENQQKRVLMQKIHKQTEKMSDAIADQMAFFDGEGEEKVVTEDFYPFGVGMEVRGNRKADERHRLRNLMGQPRGKSFDTESGNLADEKSGKMRGFSLFQHKTFDDNDLQDTSDLIDSLSFDPDDETLMGDPDLSEVDNMLQKVISRDAMSNGDKIIDTRIVKRSHRDHVSEEDKSLSKRPELLNNRVDSVVIKAGHIDFKRKLNQYRLSRKLHQKELGGKLHVSGIREKLNKELFGHLKKHEHSKRRFKNKNRDFIALTNEINADVAGATRVQNTKSENFVNKIGQKSVIWLKNFPENKDNSPEKYNGDSSKSRKGGFDTFILQDTKSRNNDNVSRTNQKSEGNKHLALDDNTHANSEGIENGRRTGIPIKGRTTDASDVVQETSRHKREAAGAAESEGTNQGNGELGDSLEKGGGIANGGEELADEGGGLSEEATKNVDGDDKVSESYEDGKLSDYSSKLSEDIAKLSGEGDMLSDKDEDEWMAKNKPTKEVSYVDLTKKIKGEGVKGFQKEAKLLENNLVKELEQNPPENIYDEPDSIPKEIDSYNRWENRAKKQKNNLLLLNQGGLPIKTVEKPSSHYDFEDLDNDYVGANFDDNIDKNDPYRYVKLRRKYAIKALERDLDKTLRVLNNMLLKENERHPKGSSNYRLYPKGFSKDRDEDTSMPNLNDILYDRSDTRGFDALRDLHRRKRSHPDSVWGSSMEKQMKTLRKSSKNDYFEKYPFEMPLEESDLDYPGDDDISHAVGDHIHAVLDRKLEKAEHALDAGDIGFREYASAKGPHDKQKKGDTYVPPSIEDLMSDIDADFLARYVNKTLTKKFVGSPGDNFFYDHRYDPAYMSLYENYRLPKKFRGIKSFKDRIQRMKKLILPYESDSEIDDNIDAIAQEIAGKTSAADDEIGYRGLPGNLQAYDDILDKNMDEYTDEDYHNDLKDFRRELKDLKKSEKRRRGLASIVGTPSSQEIFRRIEKAEGLLNREIAAEKRGEDMALELEMRRQWKNDARQRIRDALDAKKAEVAESQAIDDLEGNTMHLTKRKLKQFKQEARDLMKAIKQSNRRAAMRRRERLRDLKKLAKEAQAYHG